MDTNENALPAEQAALFLSTLSPRVLLESVRAQGQMDDAIFAGFRASADNLKVPLVRKRLQHALINNPSLQEMIRERWQQEHAQLVESVRHGSEEDVRAALPLLVREWGRARVQLALLEDTRETIQALSAGDVPAAAPEPPTAPEPTAPKPPAADTALRARLEEKERELRNLRSQAQRAQDALRKQAEEAQRAAEKWRSRAEESAREVEQLRHAGESRTRQLERLQKAKAELEAQLQEARNAQNRLNGEMETLRQETAAREAERRSRDAALPEAAIWLQGVRDLIAQGQARIAIALLAHLVQQQPQLPLLHEVLAEAYLASEATAPAVTQLCWLAEHCRNEGRPVEAIAFLCRALAHAPEDRAALASLHTLLSRTNPADQAAWTAIGKALTALEKEHPAAYRSVTKSLPQHLRRTAASARSLKARVDLDAVIQWPQANGSFAASLRTILAAVDTNQEEIVQRVRRALTLLQARSPEAHSDVVQTLRRFDDSYYTALVRRTRPVVVDGSNVAWHGQKGNSKPKLKYLLAVRQELRGLGYFPIHLYIDAALRHQIDRRDQLDALIEQGEILVADAGTDGDEQILRVARQLGCAVVTNDRMRELDFQGKVPKLCFEIGADGVRIREWRCR